MMGLGGVNISHSDEVGIPECQGGGATLLDGKVGLYGVT